jgi:hypothetical protein
MAVDPYMVGLRTPTEIFKVCDLSAEDLLHLPMMRMHLRGPFLSDRLGQTTATDKAAAALFNLRTAKMSISLHIRFEPQRKCNITVVTHNDNACFGYLVGRPLGAHFYSYYIT